MIQGSVQITKAEYWAPKDVHALIHRICKYVLLQNGLCNCDKIRNLEMKRLSWVIQVCPVSL